MQVYCICYPDITLGSVTIPPVNLTVGRSRSRVVSRRVKYLALCDSVVVWSPLASSVAILSVLMKGEVTKDWTSCMSFIILGFP
jgi:hypothetical protein